MVLQRRKNDGKGKKMLKSGDTENLCQQMLRNTMKKKKNEFQSEKHQEIIQAAQGNSEMYQYFGDGGSDVTPKTKAKEKSRIR